MMILQFVPTMFFLLTQLNRLSQEIFHHFSEVSGCELQQLKISRNESQKYLMIVL